MHQFQGTGVFPKTAIGPLYIFQPQPCIVSTEKTAAPDAEWSRFENARQTAQAQLKDLYQQALTQTGEESAAIFDIHQLMLEDADYLENVKQLITQDHCNAAHAVAQTSEKFAHIFSEMDDEYMQARAADVQDISQRLICILCGEKNQQPPLSKPSIIVAEDLTPSQILLFPAEFILGFATARGTVNSHAAILAHTQGLAAVVGLGEEILQQPAGQAAILDGNAGTLITSPDDKTLAAAQQQLSAQQQEEQALSALKGTPDQTQDGRLLRLYANVSNMKELQQALAADARGIGLFRTEFLYVQAADYPSEEELFAIYRQAAEQMQGKLVIFRTLDIGADKTAPYFQLPHEENPALGLRAIRLCLDRTDLFKTQLRALLRASAFGKTAIMYPMISAVWEVKKAQALLAQVKQELRAANIAFDRQIQTGIMIETPAAALISDQLAPLVDFFSIGTNDLIQYTCAADRQNPLLAAFADTHHPAVLKLIDMTVKNAHAAGKWAGICGELAADTALTETFLRMGIDELSVSAPFILKIRRAVQQIRLAN